MWYNVGMDRKTIYVGLVAMAAGVAVGYLVAPARESAPKASEAQTPHKSRARVVDADQGVNVAALRRRIHELERRLADTAAAAEVLTNRSEEAVRPRGFSPPNPGEWRARMEEMKKSDPERYTQMTNRMSQWRSRMIANTRDRLDFLSSLDTTGMTPKQLETHERLQALIARRDELMRTMDLDNANVSDEQRAKAFQEMRSIHERMRGLESAERDMLLQQMAHNLGCSKAESKELIGTIKTIYDATQSWGGGRHGRGAPPPPPPR